MLREILNVSGVNQLKKDEQTTIHGGSNGYDVEKCIACGGAPRPLGCLGSPAVHFCLTEC